MSEALVTSLFPDINNGLLDTFGTGGVLNYAPIYFPVPSGLASNPQSGWTIEQWSQPVTINPNDYVQNDPSAYDDLYGAALYTWSEPQTNTSFTIYKNTAQLGGGYVYDITDGSTNGEADFFLASPAPTNYANDSLDHPITLSLNAKITQSIIQYQNILLLNPSLVFATIDLGFTVTFNGAGGLPYGAYTGFAQIDPFSTNSAAPVSYSNGPLIGTTQFIDSKRFTSDPGLPLLASDSSALPETLTYSVNNYVYNALVQAFSTYSSAEKAVLLNLSNWSIGSLYIGLATNNISSGSGNDSALAANISASLQVSDIQVATNLGETYDPNSPVASVPVVDLNPQISFYDYTVGAGGQADGATIVSASSVRDKYIYVGADNISLSAPAGTNWEFGGGSGQTTLTAVSGNNVFVASTGGSDMIGGSGNDTFVIPNAAVTGISTSDTISNFHPGDNIVLTGLGGPDWKLAIHYDPSSTRSNVFTLVAKSLLHTSLSESVTVETTNIANWGAIVLPNSRSSEATDLVISNTGVGTIGTSLTVITDATASSVAPNPVNFGERHVGDEVVQLLTIANDATPGLYSERLDASFSGTSSGLSASGHLTTLAAGAINTVELAVTLHTGTAGLVSGSTTLNLASDGAGIDTLASTPLPSQTVSASGTVFNYATAAVTPANLVFVNHHVGDMVIQEVTISNAASPGVYSEGLDASFSGTTSGFSASGSLTTLAAGSSGSLAVTLNTGTAGVVSGIATLDLTSDGAGIDTLASTALAAQTVGVTGSVYSYASASLGGTSFNLGIVHVGQAVTQALSLTDSSTNPTFTEVLDAGFIGNSGAITGSGAVTLLAAGATDSSSLVLTLNTGPSGTVSGSAMLGFTSDGSGIDGLGTTALASQIVSVTATVDNYATLGVELASGSSGSLAATGGGYTLNLGTVTQGGTALTGELSIFNAATGTADLLGGTISASGTGFTNSGLVAFSGLAAGAAETAPVITLATGESGVFIEIVTIAGTGSNGGGYSGSVGYVTVTITGDILPVITTPILVSAGQTLSNGTVGNGGTVVVLSGGTVTDIIFNGGVEMVRSGATETSTTFIGGIDYIYSGGNASGTVFSRGMQDVFAGGTATGTVLSGNSNQNVTRGGAANGTVVLRGGSITLYSGGNTSGVIVNSGGNEIISAGGTASMTTLARYGDVYVHSGGTTRNTTASGFEHVYAGGTATATTVNSFGQQSVAGFVSNTTVNSGGRQYVSSGGVASGTTVNNGGTEIVYSGGKAAGTTVNSGGTEILSAGGTANGITISAGGSAVLRNSAIVSGNVEFSGSNGSLSIGGTSLPTNVINGFDANGATGDVITLTNVAYAPSDTATLGNSNLLTLDLSGTISTLQFDPSQDFTGDYFAIQTNSQHQVVIVDPTIGIKPTNMEFLYPKISTYSGPSHSIGSALPDLFEVKDSRSIAAGFLSEILNVNAEASLGLTSFSLSSNNFASRDQNLLIAQHQHGAYASFITHI